MQSPLALAPATRFLVLGAALVLGVTAACWQPPGLVTEADAATTTEAPAASSPAQRGTPAPGTASGTAAPDADSGAHKLSGTASVDIRVSPHGVEVTPPAESDAGDGKRIDVQPGHVSVQGFGRDREYDSFEGFLRDAPGTALFAFLIVTVTFLVPLLAIALLVWYKIRKTRMQHEAMLKLAERGVVPPATAMEALAGGVSPASTLDALARSGGPASAAAASHPGGGSGGSPLYEQARMIRRRTAWSDLRKGVILIAVGIGLSAYSAINDGTPSGVGLIVLFLGVGYCILWYFQDQPSTNHDQSPPPPGRA